jgi:hypothetical protein
MDAKPVIGLFLGAGASVELGLPLAWELTDELRRWLTPEKLCKFNEDWRKHGQGMNGEVITDFISVLVDPSLHYEQILGYLARISHQSWTG